MRILTKRNRRTPDRNRARNAQRRANEPRGALVVLLDKVAAVELRVAAGFGGLLDAVGPLDHALVGVGLPVVAAFVGDAVDVAGDGALVELAAREGAGEGGAGEEAGEEGEEDGELHFGGGWVG